MALIGYGQALNRDILEQKLTQYERALEQLTEWCEDEFIRPLHDREWLLHGILPDGLQVEYAWKAKTPASAKDLQSITSAALNLRALGFPDEIVHAIIARFLPWLDLSLLTAAENGGAGSTGAAGASGAATLPATRKNGSTDGTAEARLSLIAALGREAD